MARKKTPPQPAEAPAAVQPDAQPAAPAPAEQAGAPSPEPSPPPPAPVLEAPLAQPQAEQAPAAQPTAPEGQAAAEAAAPAEKPKRTRKKKEAPPAAPPAEPGDGATQAATVDATAAPGADAVQTDAQKPATGSEGAGPAAAEGQAAAPEVAGEVKAEKPKRTRKKKEPPPADAPPQPGAEGAPAQAPAEGATAQPAAEGAAPQPAAAGAASEAGVDVQVDAQQAPPAGSADGKAEAKAEPAKKARKKQAPKTPDQMSVPELVDAVLGDEKVVYFGVKHFSPACALHVDRLIRELKPVAVLVEGPDDATPLIPYIVHDDTRAPFTIFSSYVDKDNQFGQNGVLSPAENIAARFRGWWPMVDYAPELAALRAGKAVGAKLAFIDAPLLATIPYHHVPRHESAQMVTDRHLAESKYFEALRLRQRRRSFEELWASSFEVPAQLVSTRDHMRMVLTFAQCARLSGGDPAALEHDGTLLREAHMRHHIDAFLKEYKEFPEAKIVVVTGAFHSVALPFTKGQKTKVRADKNLETMLTNHSFQALATLYELNRLPAYGQAVWDALQNASPEPFNAAAVQVLIEIMRKAREAKEGVSTADAVGAYHVARNLAVLRKNAQCTLDDLLDAVHMTYIKGDHRVRGVEVDRAARDVLVGQRLGRVTSEAGQAPLVRDYYAGCKQHKLDITGAAKTVRCDIGKQEDHRYKSAFLHQCSFLTVPMFGALEDAAWNAPVKHFKGPDLATGENMHLITETWAVRWTVTVDDRLLELSDRGASMAQAAASLLREEAVKAKGDAAATTRLLLRCMQMMLLELFDELLGGVEDAIIVDGAFHNLVVALNNFVVLLSYRDSISPQAQPRVLSTITTLFGKACLLVPMVANTQPEHAREALDDLQTLVRITLTFEALSLDRGLLIEKIAEMVSDQDGQPSIRGAGYGVLYSFGATSERAVARELDGYLLGSADRVLQAGAFLDGLFMSSKSIFLGSPRLLRAISAVIGQLDWQTFKILLPDLRRAFTQFIPTEIDSISEKVSEEVGLSEGVPRDEPVPAPLARVGRAADAKVSQVLSGWL